MYQNVRGSGYKWFPLRMHLDRQYHCKNGVYGFKPLTKREFKVPQEVVESRNTQGNIYRWIEAHRKFGHKLALVNPISIRPPPRPIDELNPEYYGLKSDEFVNLFGLLSISGSGSTRTRTTIEELKSILSGIYCNRRVSAEFDFIQDTEEREWLMENFEKLTESNIATDRRRQIAELLVKAQAWENFMAVKFPTVKRYSGEGAESMLAFFWQLLQDAGIRSEIKQIVLGMPHRGRTNLQALLFNLRPAQVFRKLRGESDFPDNFNVMSDVVSHFHSSQNLFVNKKEIRVSLLRNPSHLEAVNPVAMGKTRSKQQNNGDGSFSDDGVGKAFGTTVLNVLVHGDAAFAGQGINQECLNMAYVPHYDVGGTIHFVVNNQLGFTTPGERACSTDYNTDLAKSIEAPIFHVNGDYPNTVAALTTLAFDYQQKFRKDIFIDLNCYRRWGHNELDDPTFTNPAVYSIIQNRKSVPDLYIENLTSEGVFTVTESDGIRHKFTEYLNEELQLASSYKPEVTCFQCQWTGLEMAPDAITFWDSGLDYSLLSYIGHQSVAPPDSFKIHPHLMKTHVEARRQRLNSGMKIDWATAEAMAIGSLMYQGFNIRLSGEDVGRGTFSHRHLMLVEQDDNEMYIPLNDLKGGNEGKLEIAHSILSEEAVLGFEYGMAIDNPNNLIIWEAQFGDFANAAQIIIDNFIVSGETKWLNSNGLVLLLPHGYDGAASEHSSCRIERFLQLSDSKETKPDGDNVNVHIVNPTTPAQYFHVLRRQMLRNFRKPLIVVAPKTLLRLSAATSDHTDFCPGTFFQNVLGDQNVDSNHVKRIILCSGKHYYSLMEERTTKDISDTAIIRLESLCPFPLSELQQELAKFKKVKSFIWSQEEHRNMGAWNFVRPRFEYLIGKPLRYSGRGEAATNATGVGNIHKKESIEIVENPFKW